MVRAIFDSDEVIRRLHISRITFSRYVKRGKLKPLSLPRRAQSDRLFFRRDEVERLASIRPKGGFRTGRKTGEEMRVQPS